VSTQRTMVRLMMKLPAPILRAMAGGGRVIRGGRELDAHFQFIAAQAARQPLPDPLTPDVGRAGTELLTHLFGGAREPGVTVEELTIPTPQAQLPARAYRPASQKPGAPVLVFFHFGGGVVGSMNTCDAFCTILASVIGCPVVSVEYRLAPEHRWPANTTDAFESFVWIRANAARFGAPEGLAAVGGDSTGGHMTAVLCQDLRAAGLPQPVVQLLIYPATEIPSQTASMTTYADAYPLTADTMAWFMSHYLPEGVDTSDVRISPMNADDLSGLAPALVFTAGHDPLVDQGEAYANRLRQAGVSAHYQCYDSLAHGYTAFTGAIPAADRACREIAGLVARAYRALGH
jgi:acetyl esterase